MTGQLDDWKSAYFEKPLPLSFERLLGGFVFALLIVGIALAILRFAAQLTGMPTTLPNGTAIVSVFILLFLVYAIAAIVWHYFLGLLERKPAWADIFIDIGFLSLGKYIPGKVVGLLIRGSMNNGTIQLSTRNALCSFSEQIIMLISGLWFGCLLLALAFFTGRILQQTTALIIWILVLPWVVRCALTLLRDGPLIRRFSQDALPVLTSVTSLRLGLGHSVMWLASALSLLPLLSLGYTMEHVLFIMGAYVISTLAGWVVIIAPAGIGVREAVFTTLIATIIPWEQAMISITWHRILCVSVDILFGIGCLLLFFTLRSRRHSSPTRHD